MFHAAISPHDFFLIGDAKLLSLHILSDSVMALSYLLISAALIAIVRKRRDIPFRGVILCFAAFIVACGLTHLTELAMLWFPMYWISALLEACTAAISTVALIVLLRTAPQVLATQHELSDHLELERELDWERAQRNQRIEVLARLSSELAHEIKNPLAIIHARASDLVERIYEGEAIPSGQVAETCSSIVRTSDRAIRILRGVAALAREGRNDPMQGTDIHTVVDQAVALMQGRFRTRGIELEMVVPDGLPSLECREVQIEQILVNLLNNAHDAIESDSQSERWVRVEVSTRPATEYPDHIQRMQIDVVDGGPGVPEEYRAHLMDTFFTTKPAGEGIGIGLSVSKSIAKDHSGQLELCESAGHTCFRLTLPVLTRSLEGAAA